MTRLLRIAALTATITAAVSYALLLAWCRMVRLLEADWDCDEVTG